MPWKRRARASRRSSRPGIMPAGMEMMDGPAIHAAEAFVDVGYPLDVEALLIVELDGPAVEVDLPVGRVARIARANGAKYERASSRASASGSRSGPAARRRSRPSAASAPTTTAWTARFRAASCRACSARSPRCRSAFGLRVANVFHAGDGNLHPLILYDANVPGELDRAEAFGAEILKLCVDGRRRAHGRARRRNREARPDDVPVRGRRSRRCSTASSTRSIPMCASIPGKVFPTLRRCAEQGREHVHSGSERFPDLPRF